MLHRQRLDLAAHAGHDIGDRPDIFTMRSRPSARATPRPHGRLRQILEGETKILQEAVQRSGGKIAAMAGHDGDRIRARVAPDLVAALALPLQLAPVPA
jgi:hypothetical protein